MIKLIQFYLLMRRNLYLINITKTKIYVAPRSADVLCAIAPPNLWRFKLTIIGWGRSPLELFVYRRLIIGILSLRTFAHLTLLSLSNPVLNLTFSLLPITSSHPHASASDSTFDYWRYINIWLTLTLTVIWCQGLWMIHEIWLMKFVIAHWGFLSFS